MHLDFQHSIFAFFYFEINIESLPRNDLEKLKAPSIYPISQRDFSFEIDKDISYEQVKECIHNSSKNFLISSRIFDIYDIYDGYLSFDNNPNNKVEQYQGTSKPITKFERSIDF